MVFDRRAFLLAAASTIASGAEASNWSYDLKQRARFRSFKGTEDWLFDDPYERARPGAQPLPLSSWRIETGGSRVDRVLDLIGFAEAGRLQYDAVHMSASRRPPARPTDLTLGQIKHWIRKTPGQHHAIGRYQFIPSTLVMLTRRAALPDNARFHPPVQDRLAMLLLQDAGYPELMAGRITLSKFMDNMAWIWAGLPLRNGRSAYRGVAGNRATITRKFYSEQMQRIFS